MYYPVMNVTQCEGQLSTYHLNGSSMTTPQSEEKKKKLKKEKEKEPRFDSFHTAIFRYQTVSCSPVL